MEQYRSLKDHVYDYIAELIKDKKLHNGDKLSEKQICDALGVSRTPVREALIELTGDGFLENLPRKGFWVKHVSEENAREIFEILGALDGRAAFLAVDNLTNEDIGHLEFLYESMELAIERELFKKYDDLQREFHSFYLQRCNNPLLIEYINKLNRFFIKHEYTCVDYETNRNLLKTANEEHAVIINLFKEGKREDAQRYISEIHWDIEHAKYWVSY